MDETETVFRMKRSAAGVLNKTFQALIQNQSISIADCYEALGLYFLNPDVIASWTELLQIKNENFETYLTSKERTNFIADAVCEFAQCRERLDPTSRLLLGGASPSLPSEVTFWQMQFPNILISNLKKGGSYGCIWGLPRTGKTSLAVNFMELFIADTQLHILTNIVVKEQMEQIHYCPTLSELVKQMASNPGWVAILDETATYIPKKRALSTENIDFENLGRFVGKLGGRLLVITHDMARDIPPILQSWMSEQFHKLDLTSMVAILGKPGGLRMNRHIVNIPDCNLSFITEDITSLSFDISIKKLLSDIQTEKGVEKEEQKHAILEWIENNKKSDEEEDKAEKNSLHKAAQADNRVKEILAKGYTKMRAYGIVAREMKLSPETIRYYCGVIRKGSRYGDGEFDDENTEVPNENGNVDEEEKKQVPR
jgi:hypothetical protein